MERKVSEEVMESLDKFRLKGKEEEESDSDESFQNETETKADPYSLEGSAPKSQDPFPSDPSPGPQRELSPEPKSQDPFPNDPSPGPQRELSPEPHKPASPELFGQESPEPPKTQYSGISLEPEVIQEQPKHQDQLAAFESRDPSADLLGDNFQQDQQQQQPSVPQGKFLTFYIIIAQVTLFHRKSFVNLKLCFPSIQLSRSCCCTKLVLSYMERGGHFKRVSQKCKLHSNLKLQGDTSGW